MAFITKHLRLRFDEALPSFAKLAVRLHGAEIEGVTIGAVTASRRLGCVQSGRTALIGEAAGSVDAITGEGLSVAFQQAFELAAAMRDDNLERYQRAHERIMRVPRTMSGLLLVLDRRQDFRRRVLRALEREPVVFGQMLMVHLGEGSVRDFFPGQALRLGWKIIHG